MHSGTLQSGGDDDATAGFNDTGGSAKALSMELWVAHALSVLRDIGVALAGLIIVGNMRLDGAEQIIETTLVELIMAEAGPGVGGLALCAQDRLGELAQVLFDMESVDNLDCIGE